MIHPIEAVAILNKHSHLDHADWRLDRHYVVSCGTPGLSLTADAAIEAAMRYTQTAA